MAAPHTAAPWRADPDYRLGFNHDDEVAILAGEAVVGTVWPMGDDAVGDATQAANVRLIAAAPAMLAALEYVLSVLRDDEATLQMRSAAAGAALSAIRAARGEAVSS